MSAVALHVQPAAADDRPSPRQFAEPRVDGSPLPANLHYNYETAPRARTWAAANDPQYGAARGRALYEEYHPFGTTAYRAHNNSIDVSAKRYRYTGMERDEETGLAYHGARYYASWLGRWTAADPIGLADGPGRYNYSRNNPVRLVDVGGTAAAPPESQDPVAATARLIQIAAGQEKNLKISPKEVRSRIAATTPGLEALLPGRVSGSKVLREQRLRGQTEKTLVNVSLGGALSTTTGAVSRHEAPGLGVTSIDVGVGTTGGTDTAALAERLVQANAGQVPSQRQVAGGVRDAFLQGRSSSVAHELFHAAVLAEKLGVLEPGGGAAKIVGMFRGEVDRALSSRFLREERGQLQTAIGESLAAGGNVPSTDAVEAATRYFLNERFANVVVQGSFGGAETNEAVASSYAGIFVTNLGLTGKEAERHEAALAKGLKSFFNALDPSGSSTRTNRPSLTQRQESAEAARPFFEQIRNQIVQHPMGR